MKYSDEELRGIVDMSRGGEPVALARELLAARRALRRIDRDHTRLAIAGCPIPPHVNAKSYFKIELYEITRALNPRAAKGKKK